MYSFILFKCIVVFIVFSTVEGIARGSSTDPATVQQAKESSFLKDYSTVKNPHRRTYSVHQRTNITSSIPNSIRMKTSQQKRNKTSATVSLLTKSRPITISNGHKSPVTTKMSRKLPSVSTMRRRSSSQTTKSRSSPALITLSPKSTTKPRKSPALTTFSSKSTTKPRKSLALTTLSSKSTTVPRKLRSSTTHARLEPVTKKITMLSSSTTTFGKSPKSTLIPSKTSVSLTKSSRFTITSSKSSRFPASTTMSQVTPLKTSQNSRVSKTTSQRSTKPLLPVASVTTTLSRNSRLPISKSHKTTLPKSNVSTSIMPITDTGHEETSLQSTEPQTSRKWSNNPGSHSKSSLGINMIQGYSVTLISSTVLPTENSSILSPAKQKHNSMDKNVMIELSVGVLIVIMVVVISVVIIVKRRKRKAAEYRKSANVTNTVPYNEFDLDVHSSHQFEEIDGYEASLQQDGVHRQNSESDKHAPYEVLQKVHVETGELEYDALTKTSITQHGYVNYHDNGSRQINSEYANSSIQTSTPDGRSAYANYNFNTSSENVYMNDNKVHYANVH